MMKKTLLTCLVFACGLASVPAFAQNYDEPYLGRWALTVPGGGPGWLGITNENGYLDADILWVGGSVVPVPSVMTTEDGLILTRLWNVDRKDKQGKTIDTQTFTTVIICRANGDNLECRMWTPDPSKHRVREESFTGKRMADLPPAPDLSKVKFGDPIELFNGENLDGWKLTNSNNTNGWRAEDGVLMNDPKQKPGEHINYGNLRTEQEFEDFNLKTEVSVDRRGNSGIYLRGIYEVQVMESYGRPLDSHNMGAIYSRIAPTENAEKPAGEWQTLDITLVDQHVTVILNGKKIIDNQPLYGVTGGALTSDVTKPGPIYLQGDHTAVKYRNMVLRPVVE